jgi:hypothetical protein
MSQDLDIDEDYLDMMRLDKLITAMRIISEEIEYLQASLNITKKENND